jgi:chromosome partitioning protein
LARREDCSVLLVDLDPQFNATQCLLSGEDYVYSRKEAGALTIVSVFDDTPAPAISAVTGSKALEAVPLDKIQPWSIKPRFDLIAKFSSFSASRE